MPSCDHLGRVLRESNVNCCALPPCAVTTKICQRPSTVESKAMWLPSGDQCGLPATPRVVNLTALEPSASHTQISLVPERSERKVIRLPSGEYWASESTRVDAIHEVGCASGLDRSSRQILRSAGICCS